MPLGLLYSIAAMLLIALALCQKTKNFRPGMGTEAQEASLSYPVVFMSRAPKYKTEFQLLLRSYRICFPPLSFLKGWGVLSD